jgi:hypothetical protein
MKDKGGPAFQKSGHLTEDCEPLDEPADGMSLRDWFAGMAMASIISRSHCQFPDPEPCWAYDCADNMIAERGKP